jgi:hypothetical protein
LPKPPTFGSPELPPLVLLLLQLLLLLLMLHLREPLLLLLLPLLFCFLFLRCLMLLLKMETARETWVVAMIPVAFKGMIVAKDMAQVCFLFAACANLQIGKGTKKERTKE